MILDRLLNLGLELGSRHGLSGLGVGDLAAGLLVGLHQPGLVQLWPLEDLDLAGVDLLHGVDRPAPLQDGVGDGVGDQLLDQLLDGAGAHVAGDDLGHASTNLADLKKTTEMLKSNSAKL